MFVSETSMFNKRNTLSLQANENKFIKLVAEYNISGKKRNADIREELQIFDLKRRVVEKRSKQISHIQRMEPLKHTYIYRHYRPVVIKVSAVWGDDGRINCSLSVAATGRNVSSKKEEENERVLLSGKHGLNLTRKLKECTQTNTLENSTLYFTIRKKKQFEVRRGGSWAHLLDVTIQDSHCVTELSFWFNRWILQKSFSYILVRIIV